MCVCDKVKKKKEKKKDDNIRDGRGRCQTDQLVLVIHDFSIKLDCRHVFLSVFVFVLEKNGKKKKKRRDGMSRGVLPFYSLTL